jgi:uncharacterized protein (DUF3820 family)
LRPGLSRPLVGMAKPDESTPDSEPPLSLPEAMREDLEAIGGAFMPFGKFGPEHFPPRGLPIYDLPAEYLAWFASKAGWPRGKLGRLLQIVHQMKVDGSDAAFDPLRRRAGGRSKLRPDRQRSFDFTDQDHGRPRP